MCFTGTLQELTKHRCLQLHHSFPFKTMDHMHRSIDPSNSTEMPEYSYIAQEEDYDATGVTHPIYTSSSCNFDSTNPISPILSDSNMNGEQSRGIQYNSWHRNYTLFLYSITTVLLFADQNLLAPNLSAAAEEFGFDNDERDKKLGGDIALAFFLLGAPASFLVGCAADSDYVPRSFLFGLTVLIGEGACFFTYFTTTYTGLYVTRALTGFSVGGALPLLSSVLGDWFPPEERSKVMASVGVGTGIGIAFGQGVAGFMGPDFGWRSPFLVVSIPALFVGVLVMTTVKDPERGASDIAKLNEDQQQQQQQQRPSESLNEDDNFNENNNLDDNIELKPSPSTEDTHYFNNEADNLNGSRSFEDDTKRRRFDFEAFISWLRPKSYASHLQTTKELFQTKTVILTLLQGAPGCIPWGIVNTFLNDYLSEDCGLSVQQATSVILLFGLGNFFGMMFGGGGGDILYKKDSRYPVLLSGSMAILGCFPLWILVNTTQVDEDEGIETMMVIKTGVISFLAGFGSGVTGPIVKATLQNVTLPNARGQAFALLNTFDDFGRGLGPVFVAALIVALGGRQAAFNFGIAGWILCGIFNCCMYWTIKSDEETIKSKLVALSIDSQNSIDHITT